jgi:RND family efflux transporter MFP subunit
MSTSRQIDRSFRAKVALPVAAAALALLGACSKPVPPPPEPKQVRTLVVAAGAEAQTTTYTAEIRSRYETDLSFQVGGKLLRRMVDAGANVRRGQVLAQLDLTDQQLGVDAAKSAVGGAQAELDRAKTEEARYRDLLERGLATRAQYLTQQTAVKTAQAHLDQSTTDLRLNEQRLAYTTLRAIDDGVVTRVLAEAGAVVSAGQKVLSVAQPSELEVVFAVPDNQIDAVRAAATVRFTSLDSSGAPYTATVREISPSADSVTRTYEVRASIANPPPTLRLGMTVAVAFARGASASTVVLPSTALFQKDKEPAVWVVREDLTLELRPVTVERFESDQVLVAAGLGAGERVVTAGVHRLAPGEHVRLMEGAPR